MSAARRPTFAMLAALVLCALALPACGGGPPVVGVLLPLSGDQAPRGQQTLAAVELALSQAGVDWTLEVRDTGGRPREAVRLFEELVQAGADVVLGPLSTDGAAAAATMARAWGVPMLSPGALASDEPDDNTFAFRMAYRDVDAARGLAAFARYTLDLDRVALVLDLDQADSVSLGAAFADEFQRRRGVIVGELAYFGDSATPAELARLLDQAGALGVGGVFVPGRSRELTIMLQGATSATLSRLVLLGGDGWSDPALCLLLQGRVAGAYHLGHFAPDEPGPVIQRFTSLFLEATGQVPGDGAALGYDAARILLEVGAPGLSPAEWQQRLGSLRRFDGITGPISIDPQGRANRKPPCLIQCHDPLAPRFVARLSG